MAKIMTKFKQFKEEYSTNYSPEAWEYIEENFYEGLQNRESPDILMQIYTELCLNPIGGSLYHKHLKLLKKHFPIDGNIVEVGSGMIPAFANIIAKEQIQIGKGTITIYEPLLAQLKPKYPNITLHKEEFTLDTDISKADLLVGVMACEATETILESAIINDKDFYVAMCGCVHSAFSNMYTLGYGISPEFYQREVIEKAKYLLKQYGDKRTLEVTRLKNDPRDYPILYSKRR